MPHSAYSKLTSIFDRVGRLTAAERTLFWESRTMMPPGGAVSRAKVLATLRTVINETISAAHVGELLDAADNDDLPRLSPWEAANLREMRRQWRYATSVPASLHGAIVEASGDAQAAWARARAENDFKSFIPALRKVLHLQIEATRIKAEVFGLAPYDVLLDEYEPGARMASIEPMFDDLTGFLPNLLSQITEKQSRSKAALPLPGPFEEDLQRKLCESLARLVGFDFNHGRLDKTLHPFASGVPGDIRITTRYNPNDVRACVTATVHETGHAMYEAGLPMDWAFQPVGGARGAGVHESQSLIFEMQASRSAPFIQHLAGLLRAAFGDQSAAWSADNLLRLYRHVEPGFIRVDADEVTYPLHVILRYRLERAILDCDLEIADIPQAWNALSKELLGIVAPSDTLGCLQDMHWAIGLFGYFPTYTLGALNAAQLFAKAKQDDPQLLPNLSRGDFSSLIRWTRANVHSFGSFHATGDEMIARATGKPLSTEAFKSHLIARYLEE
jgi:carboxypeptidase Taq